jgi:hypothetical protein
VVWGGGAVKLAALLDGWAVQCISTVAGSSLHLMVGRGGRRKNIDVVIS